MEIKAELLKPYTENERMDFIVLNNHNLGYEIKEVEAGLQALGYTEEELAQQKQERIALLHLTKREVFLGLYNALGVTPEVIRSGIKDEGALIEFDYATEYYRGNPLIDMVGTSLGLTKEQLDRFFEYNDYRYLLPKEEKLDENTTDTTEPTIKQDEVL